jgi:hypothetical protein
MMMECEVTTPKKEVMSLRRNKRGIASKGSLDDQSIDLILPQQALVNFHFLMK